jgi:hypothetical protein
MHFRLTYDVRGYSIALQDDPLVICIGGPRNLVVLLTHTVSEASHMTHYLGRLRCSAMRCMTPLRTLRLTHSR